MYPHFFGLCASQRRFLEDIDHLYAAFLMVLASTQGKDMFYFAKSSHTCSFISIYVTLTLRTEVVTSTSWWDFPRVLVVTQMKPDTACLQYHVMQQ